ncbi:hypothetical protein U875_09755 [Pandoraea pnomenusa 3kgm]|nr:hypothetical protein U875_09755 [Pandoraea pnomenusa 3kgm]
MVLIRLLAFVALASLGFYAGRGIELSQQWPYFEAIRTTSAIVFGVMGALLAIVYPEVVKKGFRATEQSDPANAKNLRIVVDPLAQSALLLLAVVVLGPVHAWAVQAFAKNAPYVSGLSFATLSMLTGWQVWILGLVLRPLDLLRSHTERAAIRDQLRKRIHQFGPGDKTNH